MQNCIKTTVFGRNKYLYSEIHVHILSINIHLPLGYGRLVVVEVRHRLVMRELRSRGHMSVCVGMCLPQPSLR